MYIYGAKVFAKIVNNVVDEGLEKLFLIDETQLSLGIDKGNGIMEIIIPRKTKITFEKTIILKSINDSSLNFKIYEGERKLVKYNQLIRDCKLDKISKKKMEKELKLNSIFRWITIIIIYL